MRRLVALPLALVGLALLGAGCRHDGREMRPALPSQNGSVSTSAAPTTPITEDDFFDTVATEPASSTTVAGPTTISAVATSAVATSAAASTTTAAALAITAPWRDAAPIDPQYTCKGANVSPALSWSPAPAGTLEIAVIMVDQDAAFDHWAMSGLAPDRTSLAEGEMPAGAASALNGTGAAGYTGPCPPAGATHTYRISVLYLNRALGLTSGGPAADMRTAIGTATIASAQVTGTFTGS